MIHGKYMYAYDICMIKSMYTYATTELKGGIYVYDYGMTGMYNLIKICKHVCIYMYRYLCMFILKESKVFHT
jgi:hypothetical protein